MTALNEKALEAALVARDTHLTEVDANDQLGAMAVGIQTYLAALPQPDSAGLIAEARALVPQQSELVARVLTDLVAAVEAAEARAVEAERELAERAAPCHISGCQYGDLQRQLAAARDAVNEADRFLSDPLDPDDVICARDAIRAGLRAAPAPVSGEDEEQFIQASIDGAPEPLRRLGEWLAKVLDEDQWQTAERMLLALTPAPAPKGGE